MTTSGTDLHDREERLLEPYGMASRDSRGRVHGEGIDDQRTDFLLDRDRIIHSTAFRRLEYKTQVFVNHTGDHYRTRLTHTLEVSQISRSVGRKLGLNEDLIEAIALSHDLGHSPFGHSGEDQLAELMEDHGGFNHNLHCLRVVDLLERRYPDFPGLNLTWEVRESVVKHYGAFDRPGLEAFEPDSQALLEAQLADIADSLAYNNHDLDDGYRSGFLDLSDLREVELFRRAEEQVIGRYGAIDERMLVARAVSTLIDGQIQDLIETSLGLLEEFAITSVEAVRSCPQGLIAFSPEVARLKSEMRDFLHQRLYSHPLCLRESRRGKRTIARLFGEYKRDPSLLPAEHCERIDDLGAEVVICDYIAGMTDRFCFKEHQRLFGCDPDYQEEAR